MLFRNYFVPVFLHHRTTPGRDRQALCNRIPQMKGEEKGGLGSEITGGLLCQTEEEGSV